MIAHVFHKNPEDRTVMVFCEFPEIDQPEVEKKWTEAILATCPADNGACSIGESHLVSMLPWSDDIRKAIDAPGPTTSGLIVGIKLDARTWERVESGVIKTFDLTFDESGVRVVPQRESSTSKIRKGKTMSTCTIQKLVTSVQQGDLSGLTREDFSKGLDELAYEYLKDHPGISFAAAYNLARQSETGRDLYSGFDSLAPAIQKDMPTSADVHVPTTDDESEQEDTAPPTDDGEAWQKIVRLAQKRMAKSGHTITLPTAIEQVMKDQPDLYSAYETLRRKRQIQSGSH